MSEPETKHYYLPAVLLLICLTGPDPLPAAEPAEVPAGPTEVITTGAPVIPELIGRIIADPKRDYISASGPDDCSSESLYTDTKDILGNFAADPEANAGVLRDYIVSGEEQCNCASAIVGKDFALLLTHLGMDISSVPCL